jgi:hypothetical protein
MLLRYYYYNWPLGMWRNVVRQIQVYTRLHDVACQINVVLASYDPKYQTFSSLSLYNYAFLSHFLIIYFYSSSSFPCPFLPYSYSVLLTLYFFFSSSPPHILLIFQPQYGPEIDPASNRNEYQESSWGVKGGRRVGLRTLLPHVSGLSR